MNSNQNPQNPLSQTATPGNFPGTVAPLDPTESIDDRPEEVLQLLEERIVVDRSKRKIGDVIVRKEVETYMVQVPVRRERLIVEQISPERKELASIDLSQGEPIGVQFSDGATDAIQGGSAALPASTITGSFNSLEAASRALSELAARVPHQNQQVRVEIILPDGSSSSAYQTWLTRYEQ